MRIRTHQIKPTDPAGADLTDGQYVAEVTDGVFTGLSPATPTGLQSLTVDPPLQLDTTDPANPVLSLALPLITVVDGLVLPVFDTDGTPVYTEVP